MRVLPPASPERVRRTRAAASPALDAADQPRSTEKLSAASRSGLCRQIEHARLHPPPCYRHTKLPQSRLLFRSTAWLLLTLSPEPQSCAHLPPPLFQSARPAHPAVTNPANPRSRSSTDKQI